MIMSRIRIRRLVNVGREVGWVEGFVGWVVGVLSMMVSAGLGRFRQDVNSLLMVVI